MLYTVMECSLPDNMLELIGRDPIVHFGGLRLTRDPNDNARVEVAILVKKTDCGQGLFIKGYVPRYALLEFKRKPELHIAGADCNSPSAQAQYKIVIVALDLSSLGDFFISACRKLRSLTGAWFLPNLNGLFSACEPFFSSLLIFQAV